MFGVKENSAGVIVAEAASQAEAEKLAGDFNYAAANAVWSGDRDYVVVSL